MTVAVRTQGCTRHWNLSAPTVRFLSYGHCPRLHQSRNERGEERVFGALVHRLGDALVHSEMHPFPNWSISVKAWTFSGPRAAWSPRARGAALTPFSAATVVIALFADAVK